MSFARSLNKAQGFLMPYRRPNFGRTLSNSSDLSITSNQSGRSEDMGGDAVTSAPGTPILVDNSSYAKHTCESSRPIAIELPKSRKSAATVYTPTETLSARGDLPGGYFPMHEDPSCRIRPTHPFHSGTRQKNCDSKGAMYDTRDSSTSISTAPWQASHMPVSSYMPPGMHDHPLPIGKYYPSNYEKRSRQHQSQHTLAADSLTSYAKTDAQGTTYKGADDARQRLQQYQRDMVAQATMALSSSHRSNMRPANTAASRYMSVPDVRIAAPLAPQHPISPQLQPLGSPGPVTPMDLEAKEEYMGTSRVMANENLAPPATEITPHSL